MALFIAGFIVGASSAFVFVVVMLLMRITSGDDWYDL